MRKVCDERCGPAKHPTQRKKRGLDQSWPADCFYECEVTAQLVRRALSALIKHGDYPRKWRNNHE